MNSGSVYENNIKVDASGNATISGNLTVQGTTTTISTTNSVIADKLIELGNGSSGSASGDAGIIVERGSDTNAGLVWDESADTWVACTTSATGASTGDLTLTNAALKASVITASTSLTLASGATVTAINDEDAMGSNSATALATQQSIKAYVDSQTSGAGNMDNWILEDDDGTEVTVSDGKEVKFIGSGLTTNFTDTSDGSDADPFDLTFTVDAAQTGITSVVNSSLEIGRDADNRIKFGTDNQIIFEVDGGDNVIFKTGGEIEAASLDISGNADIDGTMEADAYTVDGTALNEYIADTVGAMVGSNTETGITVTYEDGDNTLDFVLDLPVATGALNSGSITSGFGNIDTGSSTIATTGQVSSGDLVIGGTATLAEGKSLSIGTPLLPSTDHTSSGLTAQMLAGGTIAAFQTVCIHTVTGEVVISDADAIATMPVIGIAPAAISDTATGTILLQGFIREDDWNWTIGGILYADNTTAGGMTQTAPTGSGDFVQALGVALSADVVYFNPALTLVEVD